MTTQERQEAVETFNSLYPIGTRVKCWPMKMGGAGAIESKTTTVAQLLGGHTPVVWVEGHAGCFALTHVLALVGAE